MAHQVLPKLVQSNGPTTIVIILAEGLIVHKARYDVGLQATFLQDVPGQLGTLFPIQLVRSVIIKTLEHGVYPFSCPLVRQVGRHYLVQVVAFHCYGLLLEWFLLQIR